MEKTTEQHFADWENDTFGYGYGTGEEYTLPALKAFFENCGDRNGNPGCYSHEELSKALGKTVAWLLINTLAHASVIEYGTSPRYGWLTEEGIRLKNFVLGRTNEELYEIVTGQDDDYTPCYNGICKCGPNGYVEGKVCDNPFWPKPRS